MSYDCLMCEKEVLDYEPQMCCSGHDCGCMGQPVEPCLCSIECSRALFRYDGSIEERRIKAGIEFRGSDERT
jgi:hypothetical protein